MPWALFPALGAVLFWSFISTDLMLWGTDQIPAGTVMREGFVSAFKELGRVPGWTPHVLGGTPYTEALSYGDSLYPPSALLLLLSSEIHRALSWRFVLHIVAAGFLTYLWVRHLGVSRAGALVAGTGYMLAPVMVSLVYPGHDGKIFVTALAPLLFWATDRQLSRPSLGRFTWLALVVAAIILTPHFQMAYFLFGAVGLFAIFRTVTAKLDARRAKSRGAVKEGASESDAKKGGRAGAPGGMTRPLVGFGSFLGASLVGAALTGSLLFPAFDHVSNWSRRSLTSEAATGEEAIAWSSSWSIHPEEAFGLIVPEFPGADVGREPGWATGTYWGRNAFKLNSEYAGLVVLVLAAASFAGAARRRLRWFMLGLGVTAAAFALGANTPVWRIFYEVVPGIDLFRAPSQAMYLFGFAVATLAGFGVDRILRPPDRRRQPRRWLKFLVVAAGGVGVVALLLQAGIMTSLWTGTVYGEITPERAQRLAVSLPHIQQGGWIAFLLVGALAALGWSYANGRLGSRALTGGILLLVIVDPIRIDRAFIQTFDFETWAQPGAALQSIIDDRAGSPEPYRLLSYKDRGNGQDIKPALHGIELAGGHHPNDLAFYRQLIGMEGSSAPRHLYTSHRIRALLNVRYVLWPDAELGVSVVNSTAGVREAGFWPPAEPDAPLGAAVMSRTSRNGVPHETIIREPGLARARLVGRAVVKTDAEAVPYMLSDDFDPAAEVVLAKPPPIELADPAQGSVTWIEREPDRLKLRVESDGPALLVIADNWYPAWSARVDGAETEVLRAYHALRAVPVPAGVSEVEMWYDSDLIGLWLNIGVGILAALAGANLAAFVMEKRRRD